MDVFELDQVGDTLVLVPQANLSEFEFDLIEVAGGEVLKRLDNVQAKNVVIDFHRTDYYGSTAIGFFVKIWKRVRKAGGHMAFCNVSAHEQQILELTKLDTLWDVCGTREEALALVNP